MKKIILLALVLVGCGEGLTVPTPDGASDAVATGCCLQYTSGISVPGCWMCGDGVLRCVTTPCESVTTLPKCTTQPDAAWSCEHPECP
jgi:hypothetical protein